MPKKIYYIFFADFVFSTFSSFVGVYGSIYLVDRILYNPSIMYFFKSYPPILITLFEILIISTMIVLYLFLWKVKHSMLGLLLGLWVVILSNYTIYILGGEATYIFWIQSIIITLFLLLIIYITLFKVSKNKRERVSALE